MQVATKKMFWDSVSVFLLNRHGDRTTDTRHCAADS
jgi:hypothetical protein